MTTPEPTNRTNDEQDNPDTKKSKLHEHLITFANPYTAFLTLVMILVVCIQTCTNNSNNKSVIARMDSALVSSDRSNKSTFDRMDSTLKVYKKLADANLKSVDISDSSLHISKFTFDYNKKSFEIQNRGFLAVTGVSDVNYQIGSNLTFICDCINLGHTPIYLLGSAIGGCFADSIGFIKEFNNARKNIDFLISSNPTNTVKGATEKFVFTYGYREKIIITQAIDNAFRNEKVKFYVWGKIVYKDFFGKKHFTKFCGNITLIDTGMTEFEAVGEYNDAD
jgi:hypothetical protein